MTFIHDIDTIQIFFDFLIDRYSNIIYTNINEHDKEMITMPRGGKRPNAGRPKSLESRERPQHQVRAFEEEWELIKIFATIVKTDIKKAEEILKPYL